MIKVGCLKFKGMWKVCNSSKYSSDKCPAGCDYQDTLKHMKICKHMNTRWNDIYLEKYQWLGKYVSECNRERVNKFNLPII